MSAMLHNACERIRENAGIDDYNPHDVRRTAGTTMAELGVPRFIVERVLNHTDRTVTSIYDRYTLAKKKWRPSRSSGRTWSGSRSHLGPAESRDRREGNCLRVRSVGASLAEHLVLVSRQNEIVGAVIRLTRATTPDVRGPC
jgi:hypothetical protein